MRIDRYILICYALSGGYSRGRSREPCFCGSDNSSRWRLRSITEERCEKMSVEQARVARVVYCYVEQDRRLRNELANHLSIWIYSGKMMCWYDCTLLPETVVAEEVEKHLETADMILLLVSAKFLASDSYKQQIEQRVLALHHAEKVRVIPIILRPVNWKDTPLGELKALPSNEKAVIRWRYKDEAFMNITAEIRRVISKLQEQDAQRSRTMEITSIRSTRPLNIPFEPFTVPELPVVPEHPRRSLPSPPPSTL